METAHTQVMVTKGVLA